MLDLTWIQPVLTAIESILVVFNQPPFSYFIALALLSGVVYLIGGIVRR